MKRVLILAYDFPPLMSAGAARPYGWYLYMKEYGLEPIVVTRKWTEKMQSEYEIMQSVNQTGTEIEKSENGTIIKVDYIPNLRDRWALKKQNPIRVFIRKILSGISQYLPFISFKDDATRNIFIEADKYLAEQKVDVILATGGPFHLFRYASILSQKHNVPWFADFRDLWSYYPNHGLGFMNEVVQKQIKRRFENRVLKTAYGIVAVTEPLVEILEKAHRKPVFLSLNGYIDYNESFDDERESIYTKELSIVYIGTLYDYYPLEEFFKGYNEFAKLNPGKVSLTFLGMEFYPEQKKRIQNLTNEKVYFTDKMRADALQEFLRKFDVMLLFGKENGLSIHIKLFEYLLLSKPILLFGKNNRLMGNIIKDTTSGYICETQIELKKLLKELLLVKQSKGLIYQEITNIEKYSREYQTKKLVDFLIEETTINSV